VVREVREETGLDVRVEELLDADAELVRYAGDAGEQIEAHPIRLLFRVGVVGGTLGVLEVDGSTDDVAWWAPGELSDDQLTPVARRVLRSGRLNG
jgi:8-oxo-dGTP pyrophosphatase MutT (NUDIX family)